MTDAGAISVEVAYALPDAHRIISLEVPAGTSALEAARESGIADHFPDLILGEESRLGVFGHVVAPTQPLQDGDRVEIYRPLQADPKEVRKARAARAKERRAAGADQEGGASDSVSVSD